MKKRVVILFLLAVAGSLEAQNKILSVQEPYTITRAEEAKIQFTVDEDASYRLESLPTAKIEFSIACFSEDGHWIPLASNRNLKGELDNGLEVSLKKGAPYLFIALLNPDSRLPLPFTLKKTQFAGLRNQLKNELTLAMPDNLPLKEKANWSFAAPVEKVSAAWSGAGELFVAATASGSTNLQVWSVTQRAQLGSTLSAKDTGIGNFELTTTPQGTPLLFLQETNSRPLKVRLWNGNGWIDQGLPFQAFGPARWLKSSQGPVLVFRLETGVLNTALWTSGGWKKLSGENWAPASGPPLDMELAVAMFADKPVASFLVGKGEEAVNKIFFLEKAQVWTYGENPEAGGSREQKITANSETLFTALKKADESWSFFQFKEPSGWQVLPVPAEMGSASKLELCGDGGNLWLSVLSTKGLQLFQFDGLQWRTPIKLQALTEKTPTAVEFLQSPDAAKSHSLLVLSQEKGSSILRVYDLP